MKKIVVILINTLLILPIELLSAKEKDYFPLQSGYKWVYRVESWIEGEKVDKTFPIEISSQHYDEVTKTTRYYDKKGEVLFIKTKEGILGNEGRYFLKYPIQVGNTWFLSGSRRDNIFFRIEKIEESVEAGGKVYHDCIAIRYSTGKVESVLKEGKRKYFAIESITYIAPNVGRILTESYQVSRKGNVGPAFSETFDITKIGEEGRLIGRIGLLEFQKSAIPVKKKTPSIAVRGLESAFRYPEKGIFRPALSPNNQLVAYIKEKGPEFEVWLAHIDGTENQKLKVPAQRGPHKMAWSRDGQKLAVEAEIDFNPYIFVVQLNSLMPGEIYQIPGESPSWFPESERLIYITKEKKNNRVVISRFDGSNIKEVIRFSDYLNDLSLSPNGGLLAFSSRKKGMGIFELDTGNSNHIALAIDSITGKDFNRIQWTSTGNRFLYFDKINLWVWNLLSNERRLIYEGVQEAKWSPDGKRIAFVTSSFPKKFFIHNIDESTIESFDSIYGNEYNWYPDGKLIAFRDRKKGKSMFTSGIFLMDSETGEVKRRVSSVSGSYIDFSKDGKWLLWESFMAQTFFIVELSGAKKP